MVLYTEFMYNLSKRRKLACRILDDFIGNGTIKQKWYHFERMPEFVIQLDMDFSFSKAATYNSSSEKSCSGPRS